MHKLPYLLAIAAVCGLALGPMHSAANPLANGLRFSSSTVTELRDSTVQKVHRWHCQRRKGWYKGKTRWHRHPKACRDYGYANPYPGYYWGGAPLPYYGYYEWRRERRNWLFD
jgi:hypothetical protein